MHYMISILLLATYFSGGAAWAYEEITVSDGGTVLGIVKLEGQVPKPKRTKQHRAGRNPQGAERNDTEFHFPGRPPTRQNAAEADTDGQHSQEWPNPRLRKVELRSREVIDIQVRDAG